jgi:hypothetical protein
VAISQNQNIKKTKMKNLLIISSILIFIFSCKQKVQCDNEVMLDYINNDWSEREMLANNLKKFSAKYEDEKYNLYGNMTEGYKNYLISVIPKCNDLFSSRGDALDYATNTENIITVEDNPDVDIIKCKCKIYLIKNRDKKIDVEYDMSKSSDGILNKHYSSSHDILLDGKINAIGFINKYGK